MCVQNSHLHIRLCLTEEGFFFSFFWVFIFCFCQGVVGNVLWTHCCSVVGGCRRESSDIIDSVEPWSWCGNSAIEMQRYPLKSSSCDASFGQCSNWLSALTHDGLSPILLPFLDYFYSLICVLCVCMHINQTMSTDPRSHWSSQMPENVIWRWNLSQKPNESQADSVQRNVNPAVGLFCDFANAAYWWERSYWSSALEFVTLNPSPVPKW